MPQEPQEYRETAPLILFDTLDERNRDKFKFNDVYNHHTFDFFRNRDDTDNDKIFNPSSFIHGQVPNESLLIINRIKFARKNGGRYLQEARVSFFVGHAPMLYGIPAICFHPDLNLELYKGIKIERNQHFQVRIHHEQPPPEDLELMCFLFGVEIRVMG